jgi:hypothetical protein
MVKKFNSFGEWHRNKFRRQNSEKENRLLPGQRTSRELEEMRKKHKVLLSDAKDLKQADPQTTTQKIFLELKDGKNFMRSSLGLEPRNKTHEAKLKEISNPLNVYRNLIRQQIMHTAEARKSMLKSVYFEVLINKLDLKVNLFREKGIPMQDVKSLFCDLFVSKLNFLALNSKNSERRTMYSDVYSFAVKERKFLEKLFDSMYS